jgi:ABC-type dipeptide/oligopeptide/nickel transport system ATPase subunit
VSVGDESFDGETPGPTALREGDLSALIGQYRQATRRAIAAGFDVLEIHAAHGYLLHSFLSPLSNKRNDRYGGSIENRMRFPFDLVEAARAEWPHDKPLFVRISAVDGVDVGWTIDDTIVFAKALARRGVDAVDCSTGGMTLPRDKNLVARTPGFQVPFAARVCTEAKAATIAVGLIIEPKQAEAILKSGGADLQARSLAKTWIEALSIRAIDGNARIIELSGGNQQKVVIAKSLVQRPKLVIFDEPTRGVDVGAIVEIHQLINRLADEGFAVAVISSYLPEIMALSDRILVARQGKIIEEMSIDEATEQKIMYAAVH